MENLAYGVKSNEQITDTEEKEEKEIKEIRRRIDLHNDSLRSLQASHKKLTGKRYLA